MPPKRIIVWKLNQGELLGQIVQDRVLSVSEGKENIYKGEEADIYAILGENDKLTGSIVEDKVLNAEEGTQTENESQSDSYAALGENDKLIGNIVEDKVKKTERDEILVPKLKQ